MKEWQSSEKEIVNQLLNLMKEDSLFDFVPIGFNLNFEFFFLFIRARKLLIKNLSVNYLFHDLPFIDIKSIAIIMNKGQFKGSSLDWLVKKRGSNIEIPKLYADKKYNQIEDYIKDEAKRFIHIYQFLKRKLPQLYNEYQPLK